MNILRNCKLSFIVLISLIVFVNFAAAVSTSTTVPSGIWNSGSTWEKGIIPTSADDVTITQGFIVYLDTFAPCNALSITLGKNAAIKSAGIIRSTFTVGSSITLGEGAQIEIISSNSNDYFTLTAGDLLLSNSGAKFILTTNANNSRFSLNVRDIDISDELKIEVNSLNTQINLTATGIGDFGKVTVGANANFSLRITSGPSSVANLNIDDIAIEQGTPSPGKFYLRTDVYSSTITLNLSGNIVNNGLFYLWGSDPGGTTKPDPASTLRNLRISGNYSWSYIQSYQLIDARHATFTGFGMHHETDKYGIGIFNIDGADRGVFLTEGERRFFFYNCDIGNSADTGLYLKNCTRLNEHWYDQGISSCIVHDCAYSGIWFDSTNKSTIRNLEIYNNSGANIGDGIYFANSSENSILNSNIYANKIHGIYLYASDKNLIKDNLVHDQNPTTGEEGIYLYDSEKNVLFSNRCYSNPVHGIALESGSNYNYLAKNYSYSNNNSGFRVRYGADNNIFVNNISSSNSHAGFSSHASIKNLNLDEAYRNNAFGDILIEGETNPSQKYKSQIWLKNCLLQSPTEFANTSEKEEFNHLESWVISQKHNQTNGLTRIWGNFTMPQTWLTSELKWNYSEPLYDETILSWLVGGTPDLRYDDSGGRAISSITTSSTTKTELWLVTYNEQQNRWLVQGSVSGIQKNWLNPDDPNYTSDNHEITLRLTHQNAGPNPGEEFVFITSVYSGDENTQKKVEFTDFSDQEYIGASFSNQAGSSFEAVGNTANPTIITNRLVAPNTAFYYGLNLGGTISKIEYASFTFLNTSGLAFSTAPLSNTKNISITSLQPGTTYASYLTANNITHTFENIVIDTINVTGTYNVTATNSLLYFSTYTKPSLPDRLMNSSIYWGSTLVAGVDISVSTFTVSPSGQLAVGTTVAILITLKDSFSNPVSSKTVIIDVSPLRGNDILTQPAGVTNSIGQSSGTFCGNSAESKLITIKGDNLVLIASYTVTFVSTTTAQPQSTVDSEDVFKESVYVYPNPVKTGQAKFNYSLASNAAVTLKVYTILGELVWEEGKTETTGTNKTFLWNCINESNNAVGTGIYIYKMIADEGTRKFEVIKKMVIVQ